MNKSNYFESYEELVHEVGDDKFRERVDVMLTSANDFLKEYGYNNAYCNYRIMLQVLFDYYIDIYRLKEFHEIEKTKKEKIFAYLCGWIIRRKPLQFYENNPKDSDIFINERFVATLLLNECMLGDKSKTLPESNLADFVNMLLYYLKYRECNPQVLELLIEAFKLGTLIE